jgi:L-fuculose-phosphate aldolase
VLTDADILRFERQDDHLLPELDSVEHPADERGLRSEICRFVDRACAHRLMISTYGTVALRWRGDDFLITPTGIDRRLLQPEDIVQIRAGHREPGKLPSRAARLCGDIFSRHPELQCVMLTQPPNATAFCVSGRSMETRTIPESYLLLQDIPLIPYGSPFGGNPTIPNLLSSKTPILLVENDCVLVTGGTLLETFDRLEVAEFSARSLIDSLSLGKMVPIAEQEIEDLRRRFLGA